MPVEDVLLGATFAAAAAVLASGCGTQQSPAKSGSSGGATPTASTTTPTPADAEAQEKERLVRVLANQNETDVEFQDGVTTIGSTSRSDAIATAEKAFGDTAEVDAYAARVTTHAAGKRLATSPSDPSTLDPLLDDELVWLVQLHDVTDYYLNPVYRPGADGHGATPEPFVVDVIVYVDPDNHWRLGTEIPPGRSPQASAITEP